MHTSCRTRDDGEQRSACCAESEIRTLDSLEDNAELLQRSANGEAEARDRLMPLVYDELRHIAGRILRRERVDHTLQATALVHEAWLRLVDQTKVDHHGRAHFLAMAARTMRRILVDHSRKHNAEKHGGKGHAITLHESSILDDSATRVFDMLAVDAALEQLARLNERQARLVEMRFFAGMSFEEAAAVLGVSDRTLKSDWRMARVWLLRHLIEEHSGGH